MKTPLFAAIFTLAVACGPDPVLVKAYWDDYDAGPSTGQAVGPQFHGEVVDPVFPSVGSTRGESPDSGVNAQDSGSLTSGQDSGTMLDAGLDAGLPPCPNKGEHEGWENQDHHHGECNED